VFSRGQLQFQQAGLVDAATMESWLTRAAWPGRYSGWQVCCSLVVLCRAWFHL